MPPAKRRVRRTPLWERLKAQLNPLDFWLWLSEEIETSDWNSTGVGAQLGIGLNFVFLLARANSGRAKDVDDVFGDGSASGWSTYLFNSLVWILAASSAVNALYTMTRSRHYRLFEANVENRPSTPSAHRVKVQSSPVSSSPLRLLGDLVGSESADSRAHPDKTRDVWELSVWDPLPMNLMFLCFFSPGHVLVHMLFLPLVPLEPRPSVAVFNCLLLQAILSVQMYLLQARFTQQNKDTAVIQREVMHEYDTKFVHPRLHPVVREVGTQVVMNKNGVGYESVDVGTPTTIVRRGFQTHPNTNYSKHYDPDNAVQAQPRNVMSPSLFTPASKAVSNVRSSGLRQSLPVTGLPSFQPTRESSGVSTATSTSDYPQHGGNLGVFNHHNSPLKKATSMGDLKDPPAAMSPRNSREMAALEQRDLANRMVRQSSPLKENRRATTHGASATVPQTPNPFANPRPQNRGLDQERYPAIIRGWTPRR